MINGRQVGPLIEANQYDTLEVTVYNNLDVENTIHWHGKKSTSRFSTADIVV